MTYDQDVINEGALLISLLVSTMIEIADRPMNEQDDLIISAAMDWAEDHSNAVLVNHITEH
jgi:hypothetical protein